MLDFVNGSYEVFGERLRSYGIQTTAGQFSEYGLIVKNDYAFSGYFYDDTYAGILQGIFDQVTEPVDISGKGCTIRFFKQFFTNYTGYHTDIKGFTSDQSKLLNSFDIQEYSYIIESSVDFDKYATIVSNLMNPAGVVFSAEKGFDVVTNISLTLKNLLIILNIEL
jgi:hypothetical protein